MCMLAIQKAGSNGGVKHFKTNIGHNLYYVQALDTISILIPRDLWGENIVTYRKMVSFFPYH